MAAGDPALLSVPGTLRATRLLCPMHARLGQPGSRWYGPTRSPSGRSLKAAWGPSRHHGLPWAHRHHPEPPIWAHALFTTIQPCLTARPAHNLRSPPLLQTSPSPSQRTTRCSLRRERTRAWRCGVRGAGGEQGRRRTLAPWARAPPLDTPLLHGAARGRPLGLRSSHDPSALLVVPG